MLAKTRGHSTRLRRIMVLSFNRSITKHTCTVEKLETIFILLFLPDKQNYVYCRMSVDYGYLTNSQCTMTIFGQCNNALNNNVGCTVKSFFTDTS